MFETKIVECFAELAAQMVTEQTASEEFVVCISELIVEVVAEQIVVCFSGQVLKELLYQNKALVIEIFVLCVSEQVVEKMALLDLNC